MKKVFLYYVLSAILLFSCNKDDSADVPFEESQSLLLLESIITEEQEGIIEQKFSFEDNILGAFNSQVDPTDRWYTTYDSSGHLKSLSDSSNADSINSYFSYTRNENGRVTRIQQEIQSATTNFFEIEYDQQRVEKYSAKIGLSQSGYTFLYNNDNSDLPSKLVYSDDNGVDDDLSAELLWQGSNLHQIFTTAIGMSDDKATRRFEFDYDDKVNPFYGILKEQFGFSPFYQGPFIGMETFNFEVFLWQSANNLLSVKEYEAEELVNQSIYTHEYNQKGYPTRTLVESTNFSIGGKTQKTEITINYSYLDLQEQ